MPSKRFVFTITVAACIMIGICVDPMVSRVSYVWARSAPGVPPIANTQLQEAIQLSAAYLTRMCTSDGKFIYRINSNPDTRLKPRYNFLRHAGTIYALASYLQVDSQMSTQDALVRATAYLKAAAIAPLPQRKDLLAVWSPPEITGSQKPLQAKLGGTGLGLVALLSAEKIIPGTTPIDFLRRMGDFLLYMQKPDGSFYSKYIPERGGKDDSWVSLYYPGEAALGLVMLYEMDPTLKWLQAASDSIAYLARKRASQARVEADHWALLATARLLPLYRHLQRPPVSKQVIIDHAQNICESILQARAYDSNDGLNYGGFTHDGRTTPTAVRLEGLLAALDFLPSEPTRLREKIVPAVDDGMTFLLNAQWRSGPYAGGIPRAISKLPETHPGIKPSFNRRATEVRIDYVQHALSAMLQYRKRFF